MTTSVLLNFPSNGKIFCRLFQNNWTKETIDLLIQLAEEVELKKPYQATSLATK